MIWSIAVMGITALGQISNNQSLTGKYYFRQVLLVTDPMGNVVETRSGFGTLTFDGNGNFTAVGQQLIGAAAPVALTITAGTYAVKAGGYVTLTNLLRANTTVNGRLGAGALVGSSTEAGATVFDLFIAIPAPAQTLSNSVLAGAYWISSLEFPNGGLTNIRNTNFKLTVNGPGSFAESTVTGQAANLRNLLQNQTLGPMTYAVAGDGTGTLTFPTAAGLSTTTQLIAGVKNVYVSQDGTYFIGGATTAGGHGLVVGVKAFANNATNASWNDKYWAAGMRYDVATPAFPGRLAAVAGSVHANGDGNSVWSRRTRQPDGLLDASTLITYNMTGDGSGAFSSTPGRVALASTGQVFATSGVDTTDALSYEIYFGARFLPQSGTGVFLHPQGIFNGASSAGPGLPISPGGIMTMYGSGFGTQTATASAPFPTTGLAGVQVTVNGAAAPIYSVSPTQINAVVPFGATGPTATVTVVVNGTNRSNGVEVPLAPTAPGVFSYPPDGISNGAIRHLDGSLVGPSSPASRGEFVSVYLTGLGAVAPAVQDGVPAPGAEPFARSIGPLNVYIGGQAVATIQYKGLAPTLAGLYQVNIQIPLAVGSGPQNLAVQTLEGFTDMVNIVIQ